MCRMQKDPNSGRSGRCKWGGYGHCLCGNTSGAHRDGRLHSRICSESCINRNGRHDDQVVLCVIAAWPEKLGERVRALDDGAEVSGKRVAKRETGKNGGASYRTTPVDPHLQIHLSCVCGPWHPPDSLRVRPLGAIGTHVSVGESCPVSSNVVVCVIFEFWWYSSRRCSPHGARFPGLAFPISNSDSTLELDRPSPHPTCNQDQTLASLKAAERHCLSAAAGGHGV